MKVEITLECRVETLSAILSAIAPHCEDCVAAVKFDLHHGAAAQPGHPPSAQGPAAGALTVPSAEHRSSTTMKILKNSLAQEIGRKRSSKEFRLFLEKQHRTPFALFSNDPKLYVNYYCGVADSNQIAENAEARERWSKLWTEFTFWKNPNLVPS